MKMKSKEEIKVPSFRHGVALMRKLGIGWVLISREGIGFLVVPKGNMIPGDRILDEPFLV